MSVLDPSPPVRTVLVFGGARSGKSRRAEALCLAAGRRPVYVATAEAGDGEMQERIAGHRARRGPEWELIEERFDLADVIARHAAEDRVLLVDCLTLWLSNLTFAGREIASATDALCAALLTAGGPVVLVSNEVGLGIVPEHKLSRDFRDDQGRLNQRVAEVVDAVEFVAAGLPLRLKPQPNPPLAIAPPQGGREI